MSSRYRPGRFLATGLYQWSLWAAVLANFLYTGPSLVAKLLLTIMLVSTAGLAKSRNQAISGQQWASMAGTLNPQEGT